MRAHKEAREAAERTGTEIRYYNIIYNLVDDVKAAMSGLLTPERRETMLGNAQILEIFVVSKVGKIAGCRVTDGKVERGANVRLIRDNVVIHEGKLSQLKRFKDDAREVVAGQECGMAFEGYQDMRAGRRDRVLSRRDGAAVALSPNSQAARASLSGHARDLCRASSNRWTTCGVYVGCAGQCPGMTKRVFQALDYAPTPSARSCGRRPLAAPAARRRADPPRARRHARRAARSMTR